MHDLIIIGAGPAGLTAAIYARRAELSVLIIERSTLGGQITFSPKIENFPGYNQISGLELADKLTEQVLALGAEIEIAEVKSVSLNGNIKTVTTSDGVYEAKAVIISAGAEHRRLGLDREEEFIGSGISFCATCDGAFFKDMKVAVVGGGSSALQEAILLSEIASHVTIVQNLPTLTGENKLQEIIKTKENIDAVYNSIVTSLIIENDRFCGINIKDTSDNRESALTLDGVFVAIGLLPKNDIFKDIVELDKNGYIVSGESCRTNTEGIFTAGDCRNKKVRQITTACSDGAIAAVAASEYIKSKEDLWH